MRKTLVLLMALIMVFATACSGKQTNPPPDSGSGNQPDTPSAKSATFAGAWPYQVPPKGHFNTFVTDGLTLGLYQDLFEQPLAMYKWGDNSWMPQLATSWKIEGDNFVVTLRDGVKWSDGTDFTSQDVVTTFTVLRLIKNVVWKYVDKVEAKDKLTVSFHMSKPSTVVQRYVLRMWIRPHSVYGEWATKINTAAASDPNFESDASKQLRLDFDKFRPKESISSGPYKIDPASITEAQLTLVKVPTAWNAKTVQFDKVVVYNGETPTVTPLVLSKQVDYATHGFPPATEKQFEQNGVRIIRPPTYSGPAIYFNHKIDAFSRVEVRQAIAHVIDRNENGVVALGSSGKASTLMAGFSDNLVPLWLSSADVAKLNKYPKDTAKAEQLLTSIGYKKGSDGIWMTDKGAKMEFELIAPAEYADWSAAAENAAQQLTKFGIKTTFRGVTYSQVPTDVRDGKFQMAIQAWGAGNPHPHFSYTQDLFVNNYVQANGPGMSFQMQQKAKSGDVDFEKLVVASAEGLDESKQKAAVTQVALAFNEMLPIIPLWERYGNNASLPDRVQGWPDDNASILKNGLYADNPIAMLILDGTLKGK